MAVVGGPPAAAVLLENALGDLYRVVAQVAGRSVRIPSSAAGKRSSSAPHFGGVSLHKKGIYGSPGSMPARNVVQPGLCAKMAGSHTVTSDLANEVNNCLGSPIFLGNAVKHSARSQAHI